MSKKYSENTDTSIIVNTTANRFPYKSPAIIIYGKAESLTQGCKTEKSSYDASYPVEPDCYL